MQGLHPDQLGGAGLGLLPGGLQLGAQVLGLLVVALAHPLEAGVGGQGLLACCGGVGGGGGQLQRQGCGPVAVLTQLGPQLGAGVLRGLQLAAAFGELVVQRGAGGLQLAVFGT